MPNGPQGIDGITSWMGLRWDSAQTVRLALRPELLNRAGRLSGVVAYTLVDYSMGSALWVVARNVGELQRVLLLLSSRGGAQRVITMLRLEELKARAPLPIGEPDAPPRQRRRGKMA